MSIGNEHIKVEKKKEIGIITLNRPEARNALNRKMIQELGDALAELENDSQIRVIIITGNKDFCAGADIKEMHAIQPEEIETFCRWGHKVFDQLEGMGKPVIAAITGFALGGGCELVLACDIRIAGESAKLGQPEVNLGLIPGFGGTQRLSRSEEHTSELQSQSNLVCRLLLEKKKNRTNILPEYTQLTSLQQQD